MEKTLSNLAEAIREHLKQQGLVLSVDPLDSIDIPTQDGGHLFIPVKFLTASPAPAEQ